MSTTPQCSRFVGIIPDALKTEALIAELRYRIILRYSKNHFFDLAAARASGGSLLESQSLLELGADNEYVNDETGETPFLAACRCRNCFGFASIGALFPWKSTVIMNVTIQPLHVHVQALLQLPSVLVQLHEKELLDQTAVAHRRMIPSTAMGSRQRLPPSGTMTSKEDGNDDETAFRTETIERIIALQEAQARCAHELELEQLRQLEFIRALNQRRIDEEMMLAEQRHLRRRQMYYHPPTHGVAKRSGSIEDEVLMNRQARLSQLQFMSTNELLARVVGSNISGDGSSMSQLQGQGGFQRGITSDGTGSSLPLA
eukprot:scaffold33656_cov121-Skeletonema_dohrnii-CCMP3373.AAC.3